MGKIKTVIELKEAIRLLEIKQAQDSELLKEQLKITGQGLKPANLIKGAFNDLVKPPDFKDGVLNSLIGISAGSISKKIMVGATWNPLKLLFGTALQMIVTTLVSKNTGGIKTKAAQLINKIARKKDGVA